VRRQILSQPGLQNGGCIDVPANEIAGGELFVLSALDPLVEGPIEGVECLVLGKLGGGDGALDAAVPAPGGLFAEQSVDGLQRREPSRSAMSRA
jgi:hypothetical protein